MNVLAWRLISDVNLKHKHEKVQICVICNLAALLEALSCHGCSLNVLQHVKLMVFKRHQPIVDEEEQRKAVIKHLNMMEMRRG